MKKIRINFVILFSSLLLFILNDTIKAETDFPDTKLKLSGFFQFEYFTGHKNANAFRARRARLNLNGEVLEGVNFKLQVDPTQNPSLIDLHLDLKIANKLRFRAGQFKIPFSLENLTSSGNLDPVNRSLTVEYLCPGRDNKAKGRDVGLSLISRLAGIELILGVLNGAGINRMDNDRYKDIAGRLVFSPLTFVSLGSSHYRGKSTLPTGSYEKKNRTGFDVVFTINRFNIKGEWIFGQNGSIEKQGAYLQGAYYLVPNKFQVLGRIDSVDPNKDLSGDRLQVITFGLNLFLEKKTKIIFNYEFHGEENVQLSNDIFTVQLQVGF